LHFRHANTALLSQIPAGPIAASPDSRSAPDRLVCRAWMARLVLLWSAVLDRSAGAVVKRRRLGGEVSTLPSLTKAASAATFRLQRPTNTAVSVTTKRAARGAWPILIRARGLFASALGGAQVCLRQYPCLLGTRRTGSQRCAVSMRRAPVFGVLDCYEQAAGLRDFAANLL
jgi:hypothetical protein